MLILTLEYRARLAVVIVYASTATPHATTVRTARVLVLTCCIVVVIVITVITVPVVIVIT
jgi:hypothetical protein